MKFKWLGHCKSMGELKSEHWRLAKKNHPDLGGTDAAMAEINNEYDVLCQSLPKENKDGELYTPKEREPVGAWVNVVNALMALGPIFWRTCNAYYMGTFLYVTGDTKPYKDSLKALGAVWYSHNLAWCFRDPTWRRSSNRHFSLEEKAEMFGRKQVTEEEGTRQYALA